MDTNQDDIAAYKRNFYNKYHTVLVPALSKYEDERKKKLKKSVVYSVLYILLGLLIIYFEWKGSRNADFRTSVFYLLTGIFYYSIIKKKFEKNLKLRIMNVVSSCFGNMSWQPSYPDTKSQDFVLAGVFPGYTTSHIDDVFTGSYKNVNIDVVEGRYMTGIGKNGTTVFGGVTIKLDMNKKFKGHTLLWVNNFFHVSPVAGLRHTELEDVGFEKRYDVYTDDEVEARYILTPVFMERLRDIKVAFNCQDVRCAFHNDKLIIAMSTTQDLFSIGSLIKPNSDPEQFQELCEQFLSILRLIEHLKLDKKAML